MQCVAAFLFLGLAVVPGTGQSLDPDLLRLAKIKVKMAENLERLPDYTCLQTIERTQRAAGSRRTQFLDALRLEVALVGGKELFAWPGGKRFEDREIRDFAAPGGAIGNGSFALHARAVFLSNAPVFRFAGREEWRGKPAFRYDFSVAQLVSGYQIRSGDRKGIAGYHGSFWADAETLDLLRLDVEADDIPRELQVAGASNAIDYGRVSLGGSEFLLPVSAELKLLGIDGTESRNATRFAGCRHYSGETLLTFGDPPPVSEPVKPRLERRALPSGLELELSLERPLHSAGAAIGDVVQARLARDLRRKGRVLAPKGALLTGRLSRLEHRRGARDSCLVGFEFSKLEFDGVEMRFSARFERASSVLPPAVRDPLYGPAGKSFLPEHSGPQPDVLLVAGPAVDLPKGFRMILRTLDPPPEEIP